jgi:hypothetical protein
MKKKYYKIFYEIEFYYNFHETISNEIETLNKEIESYYKYYKNKTTLFIIFIIILFFYEKELYSSKYKLKCY